MLIRIQNRLKNHCSEVVFVEFGQYEAVRKEKSAFFDCEAGWRKMAKHVVFPTYQRQAFSPSSILRTEAESLDRFA